MEVWVAFGTEWLGEARDMITSSSTGSWKCNKEAEEGE